MSIDNSKHFDTVEEYQQYQKEYQELLGYCKKIRQGIDSLEEKSGERAIWELIQNALMMCRARLQFPISILSSNIRLIML